MKYIYLLILLSTIYLFSCKIDDKNVSPLVGTWKVIDWYDTIPRDINNDGVASTDLFSQWNGCKKNSLLVLNEDNSAEMVYTGTIDNPKCSPGMLPNVPWKIEPWEERASSLVFIGDDYKVSSEIIELNNEFLILRRGLFMTGHDPDIGYFTDGYFKFERQ